MTDREMLEALRALRDEPQPFASVRESVIARTRKGSRRGEIPWWLGSLAAAALLLMTIWTHAAWRVDPLPAPVLASIRPPGALQPSPVRKRLPPRRSASSRVAPVRAPVRTETLTVKMFTPDPDVVIYWIVEGQGE